MTILNVADFTFRFFMNDKPLHLVHTIRFMMNTALYLVCPPYLMKKWLVLAFFMDLLLYGYSSRIHE